MHLLADSKLVDRVFSEETTAEAVRGECGEDWRAEWMGEWCRGARAVYVPHVLDCEGEQFSPVGLYFADVCGSRLAVGHQFMLEGYRKGFCAVFAARACIDAFFEDYPAVDRVMGVIDAKNRAAIAVARWVGFVEKGLVGASDGRSEYLLVLDRVIWEGRNHG